MTRNKFQYILFTFLAGSMFILHGCMKEDYSECGLYLQFKYTHHPEGNDRFHETMKTVDVFAFNAGVFVGQWKQDPSQGNELHLQLDKGVYTIVAWGNLSDDFTYPQLQPGVTTFDEAMISIRRDAENNITARSPSLYHVILNDLDIKQIGLQRVDMDFYHDVNRIEVNLDGLPIPAASSGVRGVAPAPNTRFTVLVTGSNGDYKFDNTRWENASTLTYIPRYSQSGKTLTAAFSLMRLAKNDDTRIVLLHTEENGSRRELYSESLTDLLMKNPNLDFDIHSDYQLHLTFDYTYTVINITVNEWQHVDADDGQGGVIG